MIAKQKVLVRQDNFVWEGYVVLLDRRDNTYLVELYKPPDNFKEQFGWSRDKDVPEDWISMGMDTYRWMHKDYLTLIGPIVHTKMGNLILETLKECDKFEETCR